MDGNFHTIVNYIKNPIFLLHLSDIKSRIYDKRVRFEAQIAVTKEPVEYSERENLTYIPITEG